MNIVIFLGTFVSLALLDSLNPNGIIVTTIVLSKTNSLQKAFLYLFSIFVTYFVLGLAIFFGLVEFLKPVFRSIGEVLGIWIYVLSIILGVALIIFLLNRSQSKNPDNTNKTKEMVQKFIESPWMLILLGVGSTASDGLTSFPYFGVIASLDSQKFNAMTSISFLFLYCVIFLIPSLAIVAAYCFYKSKFAIIALWVNKALDKIAPLILKYGLIAIGAWLVFNGVKFLI
jgi:nitrate reductase NapE component